MQAHAVLDVRHHSQANVGIFCYGNCILSVHNTTNACVLYLVLYEAVNEAEAGGVPG